MTAAPDLVCSLRHTYVKVRSDGTSTIKCCFALKGTQISSLDKDSQSAIEEIARSQALMANQNRRRITVTEAAVVAVAPTTMVPLVALGATCSSRDLTTATPDSNSSAVGKRGHLKAESTRDKWPDPYIRDNREGVFMEVEEQSTAHSTGTEYVRPAPVMGDKSKESVPEIAADSANRRRHGLNWLALAEYAFDAGTLEPCQPQSLKKYYHSQDFDRQQQLQRQAELTPTVSFGSLSSHSNSSATVDGNAEIPVLGTASLDAEVEAGAALHPPPLMLPRPVRTAAIDCLCSIELDLNADCKITSVVLHYFR